MGSPEFAVPSLRELVKEKHDVVAVYTQPDRPAGRGLMLVSSPVKKAAISLGLTLREPATLRGELATTELAVLHPDVVVVAAYAKILPEPILYIPGYGCLNIHPSLLPKHRGASPIPAAVLAGDEFTGVSIMLMEKGLDTGPVLAFEKISVAGDDTAGSLTTKLAQVAASLLTETLPRWVSGKIIPCIQLDEEATYSSPITRASGEIDWSLPALTISRAVRAYNPWPIAYTRWRSKEFKVYAATRVDVVSDCEIGTVIALNLDNTTVGVVTGRGILGLGEVQLEGRRRIPAADFIRGQRNFIGSVLPS
jgi:methionyl-tRNA formyltransferase